MGLHPSRFSFLVKIGATALLAAAFDWLFPEAPGGVCIGLFALAWLLGLILARPDVRRSRLATAVALALAAIFCLSLGFDPGPLAWVLFWAALSIGALLPRTVSFDDAWRWAVRLMLHGVTGIAKPVVDLVHLLAVRPRGKRLTIRSLAALLGLPLVGTAIFTALFASANPVIADMLDRIRLPPIGEVVKWGVATVLVWPALRPHRIVTRLRIPEATIGLPGTSLPSVLIALSAFNALFALQNGLDIAFLWSGAPLPPGMSMTDYVHRGVYPLILTALLAGLFVLTMLRPGTATGNSLWARRLVALWVAQNLLLVASSALRTIRYVEEFELTAWRIAALLWMALVATGLLLICWRIWTARSARWLINANALAALVVLIPCCFVDIQAIAAQWNVRHAREVGGSGQEIDECYLQAMGPPALLPLIEFEQRSLPPVVRDRVRYTRQLLQDQLSTAQSSWTTWTPHGAMRLARARALLAAAPPPTSSAGQDWVDCDGVTHAPPRPHLTGAPAQ
jgi:hypothetical protein